MKPLPTLGVKLCGSCNPDLSTMETALEIAAGLGWRLLPYPAGTQKLTISGCGSACVEAEYPAAVTIRGLSVNGIPCRDEAEVIRLAIRQLKLYQENTI